MYMALVSAASTPEVVAVSPAATSIPANTLRVYVTFDRPARGMMTTRDLRLLDAGGQVIEGAFMDFGQDLWSPDGRRLTVLFDPGRVKRDVEGDGDSATPFQVGQTYSIEVGGKRFRFQITPAVRTPINPQNWHLAMPNAGSRKALEVSFDREMDDALLRDQLRIVDGRGRSQPGRMTVSASGQAWCWRPTQSWHAGTYRLLVGSSLEDVSGNRVGEALDHDVGVQDVPGDGVALAFEVASGSARYDAAAC